MKRLICICFFVLSFAFMANSCFAETQKQEIKVFLNGNEVYFHNAKPTVVDRRTLIPLRGVFEKMGYNIEWNGENKSSTLSNNVQSIVVKNGYSSMLVNGQSVKLDVPAKIIDDHFMIPIRAVAESTGANVSWDGIKKHIYITMVDKDQVTYFVDDYVRAYDGIMDCVEHIENLFTTLSGLTDSNYSSQMEVLAHQVEEAKACAVEIALELEEISPTTEYALYYDYTKTAIYDTIELCALVEDMINGSLTYSEANDLILDLSIKAQQLNYDLAENMNGLGFGE